MLTRHGDTRTEFPVNGNPKGDAQKELSVEKVSDTFCRVAEGMIRIQTWSFSQMRFQSFNLNDILFSKMYFFYGQDTYFHGKNKK